MMAWTWLARRILSGTIALLAVRTAAAQAPANRWQQPAAELAGQIAGILGPGQARLSVRNLSTIPADQVPAIQALLEQDLKAHGVQSSGMESASSIRVTLSENLREGLWVAEVIQGSETRVTMVQVEAGAPHAAAQAKSGLMLRKQLVMETKQPVLAALETQTALVAVEPEEITVLAKDTRGWHEAKDFDVGGKRALARDPRGVISADGNGDGFEAFVAGMECSGSFAGGAESALATCHESDDPWPVFPPVPEPGAAGNPASIKAFYNAARNYFTGVVTPAIGADLPPFYSAAVLPRPAGAALLIGGIDGKVQVLDAGALRTVSGTRDWGSDFAVLDSGCGAGNQVIATGSGEAAGDSLRAYELPAFDAVPASAPLAMDGTVTALWSAADRKSVMAAVRHASGDYEVDRVMALCD